MIDSAVIAGMIAAVPTAPGSGKGSEAGTQWQPFRQLRPRGRCHCVLPVVDCGPFGDPAGIIGAGPASPCAGESGNWREA